MSNGNSFAEPVNWAGSWNQWAINWLGNDPQLFMGDYNGDGLTDFAFANYGYGQNSFYVSLSNGAVSHLLTSINNNIGALTQITYLPSTEYDNTGSDNLSDLPFPVSVVSQITVTDQTLAQSYITNYEYQDGYFDAPDREFRGFGLVTTTDSADNYTETEFLQDDIYQGRIKEQRSYDASGNLYNQTVNTWASQNLYPNVNFAYLAQVDNYTYDGDTTGRRSQVQYFYQENPQYGNLTKTVELGEVDVITGTDLNPADNRISQTEYGYNSTDWLVNLPKSHYLQDYNNNVLKQDWLYYDNLAYGAAPALGNLTKQENWLKTLTNPTPVPGSVENPQTTFTYDVYGNVLTATDPIGNLTPLPNDRTTTITYDPDYYLFPLTTTNPLGHVITNAYYGVNGVPLNDGTYQGLWGQQKSSTDPNNVTTSNIYDNFGRRVKTVGHLDTPELPTTLTEYNLAVLPISVTTHSRIEHNLPQTLDSVIFYDGLARAIQAKSASEEGAVHPYIASLSVSFNERGQVAKKYLNFYTDAFNTYTAPEGQTSYALLAYDAISRLTQTTNPDLSHNNTAYQDWTTTVIDENGHLKKNYQDGFGRLMTVEEYLGADGRDQNYPQTQGNVNNYYTLSAATNYSYDVQNNLIQVIDALGNITAVEYDSLNRKVAMDDPDMGNWIYSYDLVGNLVNQTDAKGQLTNFTYNDLNRVISKEYPQSTTPTVAYTYDDLLVPYSKGRLTKVDYDSEYIKYYYDGLGREIQTVNKIGATEYHTYKSYDALSRLKTLTYPSNEVLTYAYNSQNQIESVRNQNNYYYASFVSYNQNNQRTSVSLGNNLQTLYTYNPLTLRLAQLLTQNSQSQSFQFLTYVYDSLGNVISLTDGLNTATQTFAYDSLNRLTSANNAVYGAKTFAYDEIGNLLNKDNLTFTYGAGSAGPHAVTALSNGTTYAYDANGSMISQHTVNNINNTYEYNAENQLTTVKKNGQTLASFEYDGKGNRIKKTIYQNLPPIKITKAPNIPSLPGEFRIAAREGLVAPASPTQVSTIYIGSIYEKSGNNATNQIFLADQRIAAVTGNNINYFHTNHLSSTDTITNNAGGQVAHYEYAPYGSTVVKTGQDVTRYKFTGKEFDDETGLYYYGARYYNPALGRFIAPDTIVQAPANPQTLNRYSYTLNNPVNYTDPTGHEAISWFNRTVSYLSNPLNITQTSSVNSHTINPNNFNLQGLSEYRSGNPQIHQFAQEHSHSAFTMNGVGTTYQLTGTVNSLKERSAVYYGIEPGISWRFMGLNFGESGGKDVTISASFVLPDGGADVELVFSEGGIELSGGLCIGARAGISISAGESHYVKDLKNTALGYIIDGYSNMLMSVMPPASESDSDFRKEETNMYFAPKVSKNSDESTCASVGAYGGASGGGSSSGGGGLSADPMNPVYRNVTGGW